MEERNKLIVADADILVALANIDDPNHNKTRDIVSKVVEKLYTIMFPNTAIMEAITALKRTLNKPDLAERINRQYQEGAFHIIYINDEIQLLASKLFEKTISKKNTIFDAVVLATAQNVKAVAILSFDSWYKKQGYTQASDLV